MKTGKTVGQNKERRGRQEEKGVGHRLDGQGERRGANGTHQQSDDRWAFTCFKTRKRIPQANERSAVRPTPATSASAPHTVRVHFSRPPFRHLAHRKHQLSPSIAVQALSEHCSALEIASLILNTITLTRNAITSRKYTCGCTSERIPLS